MTWHRTPHTKMNAKTEPVASPRNILKILNKHARTHAPLITSPPAPCLIPHLLRSRCKISHFPSISPWGGAGLDSYTMWNFPFHILCMHPPPPTNTSPPSSLPVFEVIATSARVCQLVTRWRMRIQLKLNELALSTVQTSHFFLHTIQTFFLL